MPKTDAQIREDLEVFDMVEHWGGSLVAMGLVAEVVYAFVFRNGKSFWEAWTPTIANALVAVGVVVEVYFSRLTGDRRDELERRSKEEVAKANARAEEARLETEKLRSLMRGRHLTPEQIAILKDELRSVITPTVHIRRLGTEPEITIFADALSGAFQIAGWNTRTLEPEMGDGESFGLYVPHEGLPSDPVKAIRQAFEKAGIACNWSWPEKDAFILPPGRYGSEKTRAYVCVGYKPIGSV
ncbi:MAG TPA: hypothetical protein VHU23_04140 [Rhizomicrobium sp.]|jgi:hypothetical protein|nr:hypothetical protein [Rhizomicrobium sp.]